LRHKPASNELKFDFHGLLRIGIHQLFTVSSTLRTSDFDPISVGIFNKRLKHATIFVLIVFGILILRLWFLQVVNGSLYRAKSEHNRIRLQDIPPFRGMILDRNGNVLVDNRPSYNLYVIPEEIEDRGKLIRNLSRFAAIDPDTVDEKLRASCRRRPFRPVCLAKDISRDELGNIETHRFNLPGTIIKVEPRRRYVYGKLAFHLLGYLGQITRKQILSGQFPHCKPGDLIGMSGVELKWQSFLNGTRGGEQVEVDAAGRKIRTTSRKPPIPGANVCLTIDKALQETAEQALTGKKGAIVALDPNTGEILALASSPSVDPNLFVEGIDKETWDRISTSRDFPLQNRALAGQYPPASVFKIIISLAGLQENEIDPEETVTCNGYYYLGRHRYNCWRKQGHGKINLHRALVESCDVYFYQIGRKLGVDRIARYARLFGFGGKTGCDVGQESAGLVPTRAWKLKKLGSPWQEGETVSMSIGQSFLLVTPVQAADMIAAVFNGGILFKPQVTRWVGRSETEKIREFKPRVRGRINISRKSFEIVRNALVGVVNEPHGTGSGARVEGVTVAGKTGTAQVVGVKKKPSGNTAENPLRHRDHAWFVAVAPAEKPEIALAIVIEHGGHGGSAAAPIAADMIRVYLKGKG